MSVCIETKPTPITSSQKPPAKFAWVGQSYVVLAIIMIIFSDCALRLAYKWYQPDPYESANRSFIYYAANGFRQQKQAPDIVLLGSSLMMAALHGADATITGQSQSILLHHSSRYLEDNLKTRFQTNFHTYGLPIGGQMASDAYAIASALCRGDKKPKTIIYGIAPRDLMDSTLASPASTETFKYISRMKDTSDLAFASRTSIWEVADYLVGRISFIYDHKDNFLCLNNVVCKYLISHLSGYKDLDNVYTPFYLRKIALTELPEDFGPNELKVEPYDPAKHKFNDNLGEYRHRYAQINEKMLDNQLSYLRRLGDLCQQQGIGLILVNMPLTQDNVALIPKGIYADYLEKVQQFANHYKCNFLDLNKPDLFPNRYFADSVHLNGIGGKHFFDLLVDEFSKNRQIAQSIRSSSE